MVYPAAFQDPSCNSLFAPVPRLRAGGIKEKTKLVATTGKGERYHTARATEEANQLAEKRAEAPLAPVKSSTGFPCGAAAGGGWLLQGWGPLGESAFLQVGSAAANGRPRLGVTGCCGGAWAWRDLQGCLLHPFHV